MGKQISTTVVINNVETPLSVLSDLIYVTESNGDNGILATIPYFGNPLSPTLPLFVFNSIDSIGNIVAASNNSLVQCTVVQIGGDIIYPSSLQYAFPASGWEIRESIGIGINAAIFYRDQVYYVSETLSDLVAAANAGGGGGGGSTLFALVGSNTATGDVIGELNDNNISIVNGILTYLNFNTGTKSSLIAATDGTSESSLTFDAATGDSVDFQIRSSNGSNIISFTGDAINNTITQTALSNVINGTLKIVDGTQANGYVFTSDASGNGSWKLPGGYIEYVAQLTQTGTSAPTVTEFVNTLGVTLTSVYIDVGRYALFDAGGTSDFNNSIVLIGGTDKSIGDPALRQLAVAGVLDGVTIYVNSFDNATGVLANDVLGATGIDIRVYL